MDSNTCNEEILDEIEAEEPEVEVTSQRETEDADYNGSESETEDKQTEALKAVKKSILKRKKRAARIRNALCKKSNILKIKLWQNLLPSFGKTILRRSPTPSPPPQLSSTQSRSPSPSPPPSMSHRFSPDITQYRRKPLLLAPKPRRESPKTTSSSESDEADNEKKDDEDSVSMKSMGSFDGSEAQSVDVDVDADASILLCNKGQPVVKLDASFVKDFLQSGKPIRAAALAALEAVHGKKISEAEALQRLRKAYIVKPSLPKGRGRRSIFKKNAKPSRAPKLGNWCSVLNSVTYRNAYFQVGDIVFVIGEDRQIYFLQIQSLMMDKKEYEAYASMFWLTPKPEFSGPRFPFHPKNYNLRRDLPPYDDILDNVTHVLHCPLDYFDGHPSYWQPVPGTVYQQLGEPLVKWVKLEEPKIREEIPREVDQGIKIEDETENEMENVVIKTEEAEGESDEKEEGQPDLIPELKMEPMDSDESGHESGGENFNPGSHLSFPELCEDIIHTSTPTMEIEVETT